MRLKVNYYFLNCFFIRTVQVLLVTYVVISLTESIPEAKYRPAILDEYGVPKYPPNTNCVCSKDKCLPGRSCNICPENDLRCAPKQCRLERSLAAISPDCFLEPECQEKCEDKAEPKCMVVEEKECTTVKKNVCEIVELENCENVRKTEYKRECRNNIVKDCKDVTRNDCKTFVDQKCEKK